MSFEVEFEVGDEDAAAVRDLLEHEGAGDIEEVAEEGLLPLLGIVIAAIMGAGALSNVAIKLSRLWASGVIVDARSAMIHTKKSHDLPRGVILVFAADGTRHELHEPTELDVAKLLPGSTGKVTAG